mgnify:FL=1
MAVAIKALGPEEVILVALDELRKGVNAFNVKQNMNEDQIEMFIGDFLEDYKHESIADLKICLKNARAGKYGSHYNSIDQLTVMGWFKQYLEEKAIAREQRHKNQEKFTFPKEMVNPIKQALKDERS